MAWINLSTAAAEQLPATGLGEPRVSNGKTLLDFELKLMEVLGNRTDLDSAVLRDLVNQGYIDLATSLRLAELVGSFRFDLVAGQPLYFLPQEVFSVEAIAAVNAGKVYPDYGGRPLTKIELTEYRRLPELTDDVPVHYMKRDRLLVIYPTPASSYPVQVDARIRPIAMTEDNHSPILEPEWHEAIELAARAKGHRYLREFTSAREAEADVADFIRRRIDPQAEDDKNRKVGTQPLGYKNLGRGDKLIRRPFYEREW